VFISFKSTSPSRPLDREELEAQEITHIEKINTKDVKPFPPHLGKHIDVYC
jgi:hypothetical protein